MDINNLSDINNKLSILNKVEKNILSNKKVENENLTPTKTVSKEKIDKKVNTKQLLKTLSIPVNKSSTATVELMTKMGKQLDKKNISNFINTLPTLINKFGEENIKSIILLKLLNISISDSTIDLGNFILNSMGKEFSSEILSSLNSISELLPELFKKFTVKSELQNYKLFLKLDSKISADSILNLFQLLGYRSKKENLSHLLKILSLLSKKSDKFKEISSHNKSFTNLVDTQKLIHNGGEYNLYFTLPFIIDDEQGEANFEFKKDDEKSSTLSLYIELNKLGPIRISFLMQNNLININFYVEKEDSKDILEDGLIFLREGMVSKGLKIKSINIYRCKKEDFIIKPFPFDLNNEYSTFETLG